MREKEMFSILLNESRILQEENKMKKLIIVAAFLFANVFAYGQTKKQDTLRIKLGEVIVRANRIPTLLKNNPGAISLVTKRDLSVMPKTIGAEEALRLVPGVRVDNQHDGERVHISIRGQGILTERGLRGVGVFLDGIPINDPSGFAPDLYDVDWENVKRIEILRGPSAGLYGSSASAGILNITTNYISKKILEGTFSQNIGSNGFYKTFAKLAGTKDKFNYGISFSKENGNGYRYHQAFWGNKLYEKIKFQPSEKISLTQIVSHSDYFQQNPEGLNLRQLAVNTRQANPDARPFNEYQKTNRTTLGLTSSYDISKRQNIHWYSFYRIWNYKETSNKCAEYGNYTYPGAGIQYDLNFNAGKIKHRLGMGFDFKWQEIKTYKLQSAPNPNRVESTDEKSIETNNLLANQIIDQRSTGLFAIYRIELGKLSVTGNVRYDNISNVLDNKMLIGDTTKTGTNFSRTSSRLCASYNYSSELTLFANFSQGFIPPSTEELAANPIGYSGFNTHLKPATSACYEIGARGYAGKNIYFDITAFRMNTKNDFFRFKQSGRGNQEVFYGNAGNSRRYGLETYFSADIKNLNIQLAYTYSDFQYTSATVDTVYTDPRYVLTTPPAAGQYLPNSPKHQLYVQLQYKINKNLNFTLGSEYQSKWAIYTDAKAYSGKLDPAIFRNWQKGFNIFNARIAYGWNTKNMKFEISLSARNFTGVSYMAFTEPDPDGNSYQPGPKQEYFASVKINI
jgi:iron complex outermembrane receptor protein